MKSIVFSVTLNSKLRSIEFRRSNRTSRVYTPNSESYIRAVMAFCRNCDLIEGRDGATVYSFHTGLKQ